MFLKPFVLLLALWLTPPALAVDAVVLRIQVPFPTVDIINDSSAEQFRQALSRAAGLALAIRAYKDPPQLLRLCRAGAVDHAIVDEFQGRELMRECDFVLLAQSEMRMQLYRLREREAGEQLQRVGLLARSGASQTALRRWQKVPSTRSFSGYAALLGALLGGRVDAAIMSEGTVQLLVPELQHRLLPVAGFRVPVQLYIVISQRLDASLRQRLRDFYLGDAVATWFERDFGLGRPQPLAVAASSL